MLRTVCTLTWWSGPDGYEVFFNRDELRSRPEALAPVIDSVDGVHFVAPIDSPSGGTWLLANEHGVTLAILNLYERELPELPGAVFRSRGLLLRGLASCSTLEEAGDRLHREIVAECNAFTLLGFDQGPDRAGFRAWRWMHDRETLSGPGPEVEMPVCSSSFNTLQVIAARKQTFADIRARTTGECGPDQLAAFHHFDNGGHPSAETVLMRRADARTLSISCVRVCPRKVRFEYEIVPAEGAPSGRIEVCELARR